MPTQRITAQSQINPTPREVLQAGRTYYVRPDGSDTNNGLTNNAAGAFKTIQQAINTCWTLDLNGNPVTIQLATGTYTAGATIDKPFVGGNVTLSGDTTTPSNVLLSMSGNCIIVTNPGSNLYVSGFKVASSGNNGFLISSGGTVSVSGKMEFGTCGFAHIYVSLGATFSCVNTDYIISGGAVLHVQAEDQSICKIAANTVTLTGTPAFTIYVTATRQSLIDSFSQTFVGGATGQRYNADTNSVIFTNGGGAAYLPGTIAGSTASGGQYA